MSKASLKEFGKYIKLKKKNSSIIVTSVNMNSGVNILI